MARKVTRNRRGGAKPRCVVIAGPNGAGKTTFAYEYLSHGAGIVHFVNADLIAAGLSPLFPASAALAAGRLFLSEIDKLAARKVDFAFESTLSGVTLASRICKWKESGYHIEIIYLMLPSAQLALKRIAARVKQGGHTVEKEDVLRRFARSLNNFLTAYRPLADSWTLYDNAGASPIMLERFP